MFSDNATRYRPLLFTGCCLLWPCLLSAKPAPLTLQPDTCVLLPEETHCQLAVRIINSFDSTKQLCLSIPPEPPRCQPLLPEQPTLQLELTLQQDTLLQLIDANAQIKAEGWLRVVQYQPTTRYRRKRGLGWNIL